MTRVHDIIEERALSDFLDMHPDMLDEYEKELPKELRRCILTVLAVFCLSVLMSLIMIMIFGKDRYLMGVCGGVIIMTTVYAGLASAATYCYRKGMAKKSRGEIL